MPPAKQELITLPGTRVHPGILFGFCFSVFNVLCSVFFRSSFSIFLFLFFWSWFCLSSDLRLWLHLWYVQAFRQANKHILKPDLNHGLLSSSFREYTKDHHSLLSFCSTQSPFRVVFKKYFYIVHFKRVLSIVGSQSDFVYSIIHLS